MKAKAACLNEGTPPPLGRGPAAPPAGSGEGGSDPLLPPARSVTPRDPAGLQPEPRPHRRPGGVEPGSGRKPPSLLASLDGAAARALPGPAGREQQGLLRGGPGMLPREAPPPRVPPPVPGSPRTALALCCTKRCCPRRPARPLPKGRPARAGRRRGPPGGASPGTPPTLVALTGPGRRRAGGGAGGSPPVPTAAAAHSRL